MNSFPERYTARRYRRLSRTYAWFTIVPIAAGAFLTPADGSPLALFSVVAATAVVVAAIWASMRAREVAESIEARKNQSENLYERAARACR
jgi:membrane protein implicated in regulation of membrane protease activity